MVNSLLPQHFDQNYKRIRIHQNSNGILGINAFTLYQTLELM